MTHAIRWSLYAALANVGAMIVYGLALFALFFAALIPWALGLLVVIPVMAISTYTAYREETMQSSQVQAQSFNMTVDGGVGGIAY